LEKKSISKNSSHRNSLIDQQEVEIWDQATQQVVFRKFGNILGQKHLDDLTKSTNELVQLYPPPLQSNKRGKYHGYFFGFWSRRGNPLNFTVEHRGLASCHNGQPYRHPSKIYQNAVNEFMDKTKEIWNICCHLFKDQFSGLYSLYAKTEVSLEGVKDRAWFPWHGISLALNHHAAIHRDHGNTKGLSTCAVVFGDWKKGGSIVLEDYQVEIRLHPGDIYFFNGESIWHSVTSFSEGTRNVITLYMDKTLFKK